MASTTTRLDPKLFYDALNQQGIDFFCGVPDSLLKAFCAYVTDHSPPSKAVITANEGTAVAMAAGYHLATGRSACVYLQNSGLGNAVNPLLSLCDPRVYSLPCLLLIGWRGEPGTPDEPQHAAQGQLTLPLLEALQIPHQILRGDPAGVEFALAAACGHLCDRRAPYALVVRKDLFSDYKLQAPSKAPALEMTREEAIQEILDALGPEDVVVSTTGMASREVFEHRAARGGRHHRDFLTVGGMGHASSIAQAIALQQPGRGVVCLDGDGAALMHLGALATAGQLGRAGLLRNFKHIIINNGAHDSVGGQPTAGFDADLGGVAAACSYATVLPSVASKEVVGAAVRGLRAAPGPALLEVRVRTGSRADLGRPTTTPHQNKAAFMDFLAT